MTCAVLLASYNGAPFLATQLASIQAQDYPDFKIWISDDGSKDHTQDIIKKQRALGDPELIHVRQGPQTGFANNFLSLLCAPDIEAQYFAFADQDDVWGSDKLSRAIHALKKMDPSLPALYCSRTQLINADGTVIGRSPLFKKKPSFQNALVQSIGGGNTMVMNQAARKLLVKATRAPVVSHDWWSYLLISGVGGHVFYDPYPSVRYRQHRHNLAGTNINWSAKIYRLNMLFKGKFRNWNTINCKALQPFSHLLTSENKRTFDTFCIARDQWLLPRLSGVWRTHVYRQTILGNLGLMAATVGKKL